MSRDITLADTIYILFSTRAFATGIPGTLGGTPVVSAYENDSVTQITAGITLGVDHDSVTGLNLLTIVATGANGYENGKDYSLVITTGTVDSVSVVGEVVGSFTIGSSAAAVDLANGTDGLGAIKAETASILTDTGTTLQAELDGIQEDTEDLQTQIGTAGDGLTGIPWNAAWDAEVQSEVDDALDTALSELGVAAPTATPTIRTALMLLYMALRNKTVVQTSGTDALEIYNNAGTKIAKKLLTDDGSDYTEAEMTSGA